MRFRMRSRVGDFDMHGQEAEGSKVKRSKHLLVCLVLVVGKTAPRALGGSSSKAILVLRADDLLFGVTPVALTPDISDLVGGVFVALGVGHPQSVTWIAWPFEAKVGKRSHMGVGLELEIVLTTSWQADHRRRRRRVVGTGVE
jgi:hypothetical protein